MIVGYGKHALARLEFGLGRSQRKQGGDLGGLAPPRQVYTPPWRSTNHKQFIKNREWNLIGFWSRFGIQNDQKWNQIRIRMHTKSHNLLDVTFHYVCYRFRVGFCLIFKHLFQALVGFRGKRENAGFTVNTNEIARSIHSKSIEFRRKLYQFLGRIHGVAFCINRCYKGDQMAPKMMSVRN